MRLSVFLHPWRWVCTFLFCELRRCPLTAVSQMGDERRASLRAPFLDSYPYGASSALPKEGYLVFQSASRWCCRLKSTSDDQYLEIPACEIRTVASCGIFYLPFRLFLIATVLGALRTWTCLLILCNEVFRWSVVCAVLAPLFTPMAHQSWPNKLGRWQRGLWVVYFMSDCPCPWWIAAKAVERHMLLVFISYLTPGTGWT